MDSAFQWLNQVVEWLGQWVPRWVILDTTQGAVKFVRGWKVVVLGPGVHFYWPVTTRFAVYPTARQADELRAQSIVTTDDKTIAVSGLIVYEVFNVEPLLAHTFLPSQTVKDIALSAIHDVCCNLSWAELKSQQQDGKLDTKLRNEAKKALEPYGVKVLKTMLIDLAPCRVLKIIQATSKGED